MTAPAARVLIVDDDPFNLDLLDYELRTAGHQTLLAANGEEAWSLILEHTPDLCLLDVMMPGIDGIELTRRIRADERSSSLPIILLTARGELSDKAEGFASGAQDYVVKPFEAAEVLARVAIQLRIRRLQDRVREKVATQAWVAMVGTAAHQLSQPLAGASGYLQLMEASAAAFEEGEERQKRLAQIAHSLQRALALMGKMADLRRYRTEPYACHLSIVDLEASSGDEREGSSDVPRVAIVDPLSADAPPWLQGMSEDGWKIRLLQHFDELKKWSPDLIVLQQLSEADLQQWIEMIQGLPAPVPSSMLIAPSTRADQVASLLESGVDDVLVMPLHKEEIRMRLHTRIALRALLRQDLESQSLQQARRVSLRTIDDCEPHIRQGISLVEQMRQTRGTLLPAIRELASHLDQLNLAIRSLQVAQNSAGS